jgi:hypothetical protein
MARDPYTFENQDHAPPSVMPQIQTLLRFWDQVDVDYTYLEVFKPDTVLYVLPEPGVGHEAIKQLHDCVVITEKGPVVNIQHSFNRIQMLSGESFADKTEVIYTGTLLNAMLGR